MAKEDFIIIQPVVVTKWVAQRASLLDDDDPDPAAATADEIYETFAQAVKACQKVARGTEHGIRLYTTPLSGLELPVTYNERTLSKVYAVLERHSINYGSGRDVVNDLQSEGILFRERA